MTNKTKEIVQKILNYRKKHTSLEEQINGMQESLLQTRQQDLESGKKSDDKFLQDKLRERRFDQRAVSTTIDDLEATLNNKVSEEVKREQSEALALLDRLIIDIAAAQKIFFEELGRLEAFRQLNLPNSIVELGSYLIKIADSEDIGFYSNNLEKIKKEQWKESLAQKYANAQDKVRYFKENTIEEIVRNRISELLKEER